jgi:uncharacterized repeat protein (TIGR01451 family)
MIFQLILLSGQKFEKNNYRDNMGIFKLMLTIVMSFLLIASTMGSAFAGANIELSFNTTTANVGDPVTMFVVITNTGPGDLSGVTVSAPLPAGLMFMTSATGTTKNLYDSSTGFWQVDNLRLSSKNGGKKTLTITAEIQPAASGKTLKATAAYLSVYNGTPPVLLPLNSATSQIIIKRISTDTGSNTGATNTSSSKSTRLSSNNSNSKINSIVSKLKDNNNGNDNNLLPQQNPNTAYEVFNSTEGSNDNVPPSTYAIIVLVGIGILVVVGYIIGIRKL